MNMLLVVREVLRGVPESVVKLYLYKKNMKAYKIY